MEKKLKITLCILIIALISIIAFVGVYSKNQITYDNVLPSFSKATELQGKRITGFKVNTDKEEVIYDKDGNKVDAIPEGANEEEYRKEENPTNKEEVLTSENYKKVKEIFEGRLKDSGIAECTVRLNEQNGNIAVEIPENSETDKMVQFLMLKGTFMMTDADDGTVLLDMNDIESASTRYATTSEGQVAVYLSIQFNEEGTKKLEEVSKNYLEVEEEEETDDESSDVNETTENTVAEDTTAENTENNEEETKQKNVTLTIEDVDVLSTHFKEVITKGDLSLAIGRATTQEELNNYLSQARIYAMILNNGTVPVVYDVVTSEYIGNDINENMLYIMLGAIAALTLAIIVYMVIKYKVDGLLTGISLISMIAMLVLMIRYTNTTLSIGGIVSALVLIAIETYYMLTILKKIKEDGSFENVSNVTLRTYFDKLEIIVVLLIIAVLFTFMNDVRIYSIGMTVFYGVISIIIANLVFMRIMLKARHK